MMNGFGDWDAYRLFLAVAETGSLSAAGRKLGMSHATVGRHIAALEKRLGARLFMRQADGYTPTPAAERLKGEVERMADAVSRAELTAREAQGEPRGEVRLATVHSLCAYWLMPYLTEFYERHQGITLELMTELTPVSVKRREADVVLRLYGPGRENIVGRKVGRCGVGFYASHAYAEKHGLPTRREEWHEHAVVEFAGEAASFELNEWLRHVTQGARVSVRTASVADQIQAIRAGLGISTLMCLVGDAYPDLVQVSPHKLVNSTDIWLLAHPDLKDSGPVRAVLDFISEKARQDRTLLAGR